MKAASTRESELGALIIQRTREIIDKKQNCVCWENANVEEGRGCRATIALLREPLHFFISLEVGPTPFIAIWFVMGKHTLYSLFSLPCTLISTLSSRYSLRESNGFAVHFFLAPTASPSFSHNFSLLREGTNEPILNQKENENIGQHHACEPAKPLSFSV